MTLELLKAGLQKLVDEDNNQEAKQAIDEINEIKQRVDYDAWNDECYILYADTVCNLLNISTYDAYGKLYVKKQAIGHQVTLSDYEKECREKYDLDLAPTSVIQLGYEVIRDLYSDNEADGAHNPDGTFRYDKAEEFNHIKNLCEFLTDHEDFKEQFAEDSRELFAEHVFNLIAECDVDEPKANDIADKLTTLFF